MSLQLRLRYAKHAVREVAAWFLPCAEPVQWLPEIARWQDDHRETRLRLVPHSLRDRRCCGVLVTTKGKQTRPTGIAGIAYGRIGTRFYLPVDAELDPPITPEELESLLSQDRDYVYHPHAGLVGFEPHEIRGLADFLERPPARAGAWNRARAGLVFQNRLYSVSPLEPPEADAVIRSGADDIGSEHAAGQQPKPSAHEPDAGVLGKAARGLLGGTAVGIGWLASQIPASLTPAMVQQAATWAAQKLAQISAANDFLRNKEIARLMNLLRDNPDEGLKYALPLSDMNASRGIAAPGNRLTQRPTEFRLFGNGTGPADVWNIDAQRQAELHRRYRELAEREMNLGRFRRAAYIYAHLLNDVLGAAGALRSGKHWREAAALYREKLNRPEEAARCLVEGKLFQEAIPILEELRKYEQVGDLYILLKEPERARTAFRLAVQEKQTQGDFLGAAQLLDDRLQEEESALLVLAQGWPDTPQAEQCLQALWHRLDQKGRYDDLLKHMEQLREQVLRYPQRYVRVKTLAEWAKSSSNVQVQAFAADAVRIVAARELPAADKQEVSHLMSALRRLAEGDKLLGRDTARCERLRFTPSVGAATTRLQGKSNRATFVNRFVLWTPQPVEWLAAVKSSDSIYAVGRQDVDLLFARAKWDGHHEIQPLNWRYPHAPDSLVLSVAEETAKIYLALLHQPDCQLQRWIPGSDLFPECAITSPPFYGEDLLGMTTGNGRAWGVTQKSRFVLHSVDHDGTTVHSAALPALKQPLVHPVPMIVQRDIIIGWGAQLLIGTKPPIEMESAIKSLSASSASSGCLAVGFDTGGVVYFQNTAGGHLIHFGEGLGHVTTGFTRSGYLVAISNQGGEIYDTRDKKLRLAYKVEPLGVEPIAVLPTNVANQFGVALADGRIFIYSLA